MRFFLYAIATFILIFFTNFTIVQAQYDGGGDGGYDGSYNDGGYDGCYGSCGGPPVVSGYVFEDRDLSTTYNAGDNGIAGEVVQVLQSGVVVLQTMTDAGGHYSITFGTTGTFTIHHAREPLWPGWTRTTPNDVTVSITGNKYLAFGMSRPPFGQYLPDGRCIGSNPNIHISWDPYTTTTPAYYRIHYIDDDSGEGEKITGPLPSTTTSYDFSPSTTPLTPGEQYTFIIGAFDSSGTLLAWSDYLWSSQKFGTYTTYRADCSPPPPPPPTVTLQLNNASAPQLAVNKGTSVSLSWTVMNVNNTTSCVATTTNPSESYWSGAPNSVVNPVSNPIGTYSPLDTQTIGGPYDYKLTCTNTNSSGLSSSDQYTVKLTVRQILKPYIQTTGGDVHTNESISIPE